MLIVLSAANCPLVGRVIACSAERGANIAIVIISHFRSVEVFKRINLHFHQFSSIISPIDPQICVKRVVIKKPINTNKSRSQRHQNITHTYDDSGLHIIMTMSFNCIQLMYTKMHANKARKCLFCVRPN